MGVAPGGIDRPDVGELVVKLIAVDLLAALIAISRIAFVGAGGELTAIVRVAGAVQRQRAVVAAGRIFLQIGAQQQRGVAVRLPQQGRRNRVALFAGMVILRVAAAGHPDQPPCPLVIDGVGVIEGRAFGILRPASQADVALLTELRALGGQVDHAARHALPVERGGGAADHIDAFDKPRVDLHHVMAAAVAHQTHAVEEQVIDVAAVVAAQGDGVEPGGAAAEAGVDPRGIFQRLADGIRPLIRHLLAGDHRHRLGGSD